MSSSEFHERLKSKDLRDFRLGTVASSDHETPLTVQLRVVHVFDVVEPKKQRKSRFDNCVADSDFEDEESDQGSCAFSLCSRGETSAEDAGEDDVMGKELSASSSGEHKESEDEFADVQGCKIGHTSQWLSHRHRSLPLA